LRLHRVFRRAVKRFDAQVLFDPFEEKFDGPTGFVQRGDDERCGLEIGG